MSVNIRCVPVQGPTPDPIVAKAQCVGTPGARMHKVKPDPKNPKPYALFNRVKDHRVESRLLERNNADTQALDEKMAKLWELGHDLLKHTFKITNPTNVELSLGHLKIECDQRTIGQNGITDKIHEVIKEHYPGAKDIAIDFSDNSISFLQNGRRVEIETKDVPAEVKKILEYIQVWKEAHTIAARLLGFTDWHTRHNIDANRPIYAETPFKIENKAWKNFVPKTFEEFMKFGHYEALMEKLPEDRREIASKKMEQAVKFIDAFKEKIAKQLQDKVDTNEIQQLQSLQKRLDDINLYAVLWAVAFSTDAEHATRDAQILNSKMGEVFAENRDISPEKAFKLNLLEGKPDPEDLKAIRIQTGALLFHGDTAYLTYFNSSEASKMVKTSIEEFVVHNMMYMDEPEYEDDLRSLDLQMKDPVSQREMRDLINEARASVKPPDHNQATPSGRRNRA